MLLSGGSEGARLGLKIGSGSVGIGPEGIALAARQNNARLSLDAELKPA